ncbi:MAG: class I SAM-dependent methyltransferase [Candidatus Sulfotelmatobacter sp.]
MPSKPDYGVDAPGVIRNLFLAAVVGVLLVLFAPRVLHIGSAGINLHPTGWGIAIGCGGGGLLMLIYAKFGKFRHRDRMLDLHNWRGDEQVLDVGTGRGLLLVGAALRLTTGHATGIDIWNKEDLSGNALQRTEQNLAVEGVTEKCSLVSEGAQKMSFPDNSFDVILSNLCLHNIYDRPTRLKACNEIARVLKAGGVAIISDFKHTREYAEALRKAGLRVERKVPNFLTTYPPLRILLAYKN